MIQDIHDEQETGAARPPNVIGEWLTDMRPTLVALLIGLVASTLVLVAAISPWMTPLAPGELPRVSLIRPDRLLEQIDVVVGVLPSGDSEIELRTTSGADLVARIHTGYDSLVALRGARDVLVSDLAYRGVRTDRDAYYRLMRLDRGSGLSVRAPILELENRVGYTVLRAQDPGLLVAPSGRILYYLTRRLCGPSCAEYGVGIVDLDTNSHVARIWLSSDCIVTSFTSVGEYLGVDCSGKRWLVAPDGGRADWD